MIYPKIIGTGSHVPEKVITNFDLEKLVDTSDEWITTRTGIRERRVVKEDVPLSALAFDASKKAIRSAGIEARDLDLIIVGTISPDMQLPSTACFLQEMLGAKRAAAFDIAAACSGFIYALSIAEQYIKTGSYKTILIVGAEVLSKVIDWTDRSTCVIFSDGAGAAVLQASSEPSQVVLSTHLFADGQFAKYLYIPGGGSLHPASHETVDKRMHYVKMSGNELFKVAIRSMEEACLIALKHNGLRPEDVDLLIPHQANLRIIEATAKRLNLPMEKVVVTIHKYGNASSATIPIALDETIRAGKVKKGNIILSVAFGGGVTWASTVIRW